MKSHSDKNTKQPKLRFPGFTGEWKEKRLKDYSALITKGTTPNYFSKEGVKFIKIESLDGANIVNEKCLYIDNDVHFGALNRSVLKENDILFAIAGATIGKVAVVKKENLPANTNQALSIIRLKDYSSLNYILHILQSEVMRKYILESISVGAQPNLNLQQMGNFSFYIPSLPEQNKIAEFLSDIDTKIEKLARKKQLTEQYKKGAMQKIFSQKIRFKDEKGKNYPDWEEKRLGDVAEFIQTNSFSRECMNYKAGQVQNIHYGDIHMRYPSILNVKSALIPYINEDVNIEKYNNINFCQNGDIIFADASEDTKDIGKCIEITNMSKEKILAGLHTIHVRFKAKMALGYNGHYLSSPYVKDQIMKLAQGISVFGISKKAISELEIMLPVLEEQKKIADFLIDLDTRIEHINKELARLKEFKKGLLQGMFV